MQEFLKEMQTARNSFIYREQMVDKMFTFLSNYLANDNIELIEKNTYTVVVYLQNITKLPTRIFANTDTDTDLFECDSISITCLNEAGRFRIIETILRRNKELLGDTVARHDHPETTTYENLMAYINSVTSYTDVNDTDNTKNNSELIEVD